MADVTPESFGCAGDGTTDDTVNFQAALTSVSNGVDNLALTASATYLITDYLYFWGSCNITGATDASILLRHTDKSHVLLIHVGISGVNSPETLWNGTIDGVVFTTDMAPGEGWNPGRIIYFWITDGGTLTNCEFYVGADTFSATSSGNNANWLNTPATRLNITLTNNTITATSDEHGSEGFGIDHFDGLVMTGNTVTGVGDDPIAAHQCTDVLIDNNTMTSVDGRLFVVNCVDAVVTNNRAERCEGSTGWKPGIALIYIGFENVATNSFSAPIRNLIESNTCISPVGSVDLGAAIHVFGPRDVTVRNNILICDSPTCTTQGVYVQPRIFTGSWTDPDGLDTDNIARPREFVFEGNSCGGEYPQGVIQSGQDEHYIGPGLVTGNTAGHYQWYMPAKVTVVDNYASFDLTSVNGGAALSDGVQVDITCVAAGDISGPVTYGGVAQSGITWTDAQITIASLDVAGLDYGSHKIACSKPVPTVGFEFYASPAPFTFARTSIQTGLDNNGLIVERAAGESVHIGADYDGADYTNTSGNSKGILLEAGRSNEYSYSEDYANAAWVKVNITPEAGAGSSPVENNQSPQKITLTAGTSNFYMYQIMPDTTAGVDYPQLLVAKAAGHDFLQLTGSTGFNTGVVVNYDLANGTYNSTGLVTPDHIYMDSLGDGWYLVGAVMIAASTGATSRTIWGFSGSLSDSRLAAHTVGSGTGVYVAGGYAQDRGEFKASLLPSLTTPVTRSTTNMTATAAEVGLAADVTQNFDFRLIVRPQFDANDALVQASALMMLYADATNHVELRYQGAGNPIRMIKTVDGAAETITYIADDVPFSNDQRLDITGSCASTGMSLQVAGYDEITGTDTAALNAAITQVRIGSSNAGRHSFQICESFYVGEL